MVLTTLFAMNNEAENSGSFLNQQRQKTNLVSLTEMFADLIEQQTKTVMLANASDEYVFRNLQAASGPRAASPSQGERRYV